MSRSISPNSRTYELNTTSHTPYRNALIEQEMLSQLKGEVFGKGQKRLNYDNLLAKYHKLQEDLEKLIQIKNQHLVSLNQLESDEKNLLINELKNKNDNLLIQLNDRIAINNKLYNENIALFKEMESKKKENQDLKNEILRQEDLLRRLSFEKDEIEKKIFNLNQIREKQEMDIFNFNEEKFNINNQNAEKGNLILSRSGENADIYNEINDEKIINKNLILNSEIRRIIYFQINNN